MYTSRVERTFEAAHHNGPPGHRCQTVHGHSWRVQVELRYSDSDLDEYGWGPDFGRVKRLLDDLVVSVFDHNDLNDVLALPSAEHLARYVFETLEAAVPHLYAVIIYEGAGNAVKYQP